MDVGTPPDHRVALLPRRHRPAWSRALRVGRIVLLGVVLAVVAGGSHAGAAPALTIEPITWDVIGLDSNGWATEGPDTFPVGARVCNVGPDPADNVAVDFVWESANSHLSIVGASSLTESTIAAGACFDFMFNVRVARDSAAFDTARSYRIDATADGLSPISTPTPREIFVERLVSQNRNQIEAITGPGGIGDPPATDVIVGQTYTYMLFGSTATQGYEQLEVFLDFPNIIFRVLSVDSTYSAPTGATNDLVYADACGWDPDPSSPTYLECIGPPNFGSGKAGGDVEMTYVVEILSAGSADVTALIYDFSGSSFHYNSDYGVDVASITITATAASADLSVTKTDSIDPVPSGEPLTYDIDVTNLGPADATDVALVDTLPPGVTFQSASGSGWACSEAGGTVTCDLATLATGATSTVQVQVLAPGASGTISNSVSVSSAEPDPIPANNVASENTDVVASADLAITKTDSPDPVPVGGTLSYTLQVTNNGPSAASSVVVTDPIPPGTSFVSATPTTGSCAFAGGVVTCDLGTLADSAVESVAIDVTPQPGSEGSILNTAAVTSATPDPDSTNNTDSETTTVTPSADVSVVKSDVADPVVEGSDIIYSIVVSNAGPSTASSVSLTDTLPAGTAFVSATPTQGSCPAPAGGTLTCDLGDLGSGGSATINLVVTPSAAGSYSNTVSVTTTTPDPVAGNDSDSETTDVVTGADLRVTKTDTPDPVLVGNPLTYTVTVENLGPSSATNVTMTDVLPATVTFVSATPSQGSCGAPVGGTLTCNLGTITNGATATVGIDVTPTVAGIILNTASAVADDPDPTPGNNASEVTTVSPAATTDLVLTKTDDVDPVGVGEQVVYTLTVANVSAVDATGVDVEDTLPAFMSLVSAVPSQGSCTDAGGVLSCLLGTINAAPGPGDQATIVVTMTALAGGEFSTVTNSVSVDSIEDDSTPANNTVSETTAIDGRADLGVVKTDDADPIPFGDTIGYSVVVTNYGPTAATDVQVVDSVTAASILTAVPTQGGPCTIGAGGFTCALGDLPLGATASIAVTATPDSAATVTNDVVVSSSTPEPVGATNPNSDSETTTIEAAADLSVTKADSVDPAQPSSTLTYTLIVTNNGPSDASGVAITDLLPTGVAFVSATPSQGSCSEAGGVVGCALGTITNGNTATITVDVVPGADAVGTISNTVSVTGNEPDPDIGNNQDTEDTTVAPAADLEVTKTDGVTEVVAGTSTTYTISLHNNGPSIVPAGVVVVDTVPAGTSGSEAEADCTAGGGIVTCTTTGPLGVGETVEWDVTVDVPADHGPGTIQNQVAIISTPILDPTPGNDTAVDTDDVVTRADLAILKSDADDPVRVGDDIGYTVSVSNIGPSSAAGVQVIDILPATVDFVSASSTQGSCTEAGGAVTCALGTIAPGDPVTIDILVTTQPGSEGTVFNLASVSATTNDPDPSDNTTTEATDIEPVADLEVTKTGPADAVGPGEDVVYDLVVTNRGPSGATAVVVTDTLPAALTFVSAVPSQGSCTEAGGTVSCSIGSVANGGTATIAITAGVSVDAVSGSLTNTVSIAGAEFDPVDSNNDDAAVVTVDGNGLPVTGIPLDWFLAMGVMLSIIGAAMVFGTRPPRPRYRYRMDSTRWSPPSRPPSTRLP